MAVSPKDFRLLVPLRVRFGETDAVGVVYNANYLAYFEVGRIEYERRVFSGEEGSKKHLEELQLFPQLLKEACVTFHAPAHFDDPLLIGTRVTKMGRTSFRFEYGVFDQRSAALIATGYSIQVAVGDDNRPVPIPDDIRAKFAAFDGLDLKAGN